MSAITHTSHARTARTAVTRARGTRYGGQYRYRRTHDGLQGSEALLLGLVLVLLVVFAFASRPTQPGPVDTTSVRVGPGQTLWAIAGDHPVAGLSTEQTADLIARLNGIDAARLQAGAVIRVPVDDSHDSALATR